MDIRRATAGDTEQIVALQIERNGADAEPPVRQLLADPSVGPDRFTVAVEDGRVVSSLCLLDQAWTLDGVDIPGGQPEYVATDVDYGNRGLVRAQMELIHEWSDARGDLLQVIAGIPYFYRQFGYEYAVAFPTTRLINPGVALEMPDRWTVRPADVDDLDEVRRLQSAAQADASLVAHPDDAWWRASITSAARPWYLAERDDGSARAGGMIGPGPPGVGEAVTVVHAPSADRPGGLWALLAEAAKRGTAVGFESRRGSTASLDGVSHPHPRAYGLYARVADPVALLSRLKPVLSERLRRSPRGDGSGQLLLSSYASSVLITWEQGDVVSVERAAGEQSPTRRGGVGVPPDQLTTLLLGRHGAAGLAARHDDVDYGSSADLMEILFPQLATDVSLLG